MKRWILLLSFMLGAACESSTGPQAGDSQPPADTGALDQRADALPEAGAGDHGLKDGGPPADIAGLDTAQPDAGPLVDGPGADALADGPGADALADGGATPTWGQYSCPSNGLRVPADYPTLKLALDQIGNTSGGTVCLAAGNHTTYMNPSYYTKAIVIQGAGVDKTFIKHPSFMLHGLADVTLQGMTVESAMQVSANAAFHGRDLRLTGGVQVLNGFSWPSESYTFERCAITSAGSFGLTVRSTSSYGYNIGQYFVTLKNCYIHHATTGVRLEDGAVLGGYLWPKAILELEHNTIDKNSTGLSLNAAQGGHEALVLLRANIIAHSSVGVEVLVPSAWADKVLTTRSENALFSNTQDHKGLTAYTPAGMTDIFQSCQLDSAFPPRPAKGSPCHDGASAGLTTDFFNNKRDAKPDIGAVERQP